MQEMSASSARLTALAAQGLATKRTRTRPATTAAVYSAIQTTGLLQIDSVSVVVRAHYAPVFSRVGAYDTKSIDDAAWTGTPRRPRRLVEYWAHEAALLPVQDWPLMRWRMALYRRGRWGGAAHVLDREPKLVDDVLAVIDERGATSAGEIEKHLDLGRSGGRGPWWDRSDVKIVCEQLFAAGVVTVPSRDNFVRKYELSERVIPADILHAHVDEPDAVRALIEKASRALGIGTEPDLRDYYRLSHRQSKAAIEDLLEEGTLEQVGVRGWNAPAYIHREARTPRAATAAALLCPFDPMIFYRPRVERIFGFHYRIEIYTPQHKRIHGYYVFPFLLDGHLVARVDLKAVRATSELRVIAAYTEGERDHRDVAPRLRRALEEMAGWLRLERVVVGDRGDLVSALR